MAFHKLVTTLFLTALTLTLAAQDIQKQLQTQLIMAGDGDTIYIPEGKFSLQKSLLIDGKKNIVIKGRGMDKSILNFKGQTEGAEGLKINQCTQITLIDFTVQDAKGDCIKAMNCDQISFIRVKTEWTAKPSKKNGAYGLYPVSCTNLLIDGCISIGASDAGIYVGQSDMVIVKNSEAYHNVAGIEIENTTRAEVFDNYSHDNTGGLLIFDMPELPKKHGGEVKVYNNRIIHNNFKNFAPKGNIVGQVPPGTGTFVLATRKVEIANNLIEENKTVSIGICSYYISERAYNDSLYNPYPGTVYIHDNQLIRKKTAPATSSKIGLLLAFKFGKKTPHIVYDGILDKTMIDENGNVKPEYMICIEKNTNETFVNLDAGNNFKNFSFDLSKYRCTLNIPIK